MLNIKTGATQTGGSTVGLTPAGVSPGKSVYTGPSNTRLQIQKVEFTSSTGNASKDSLGSARAGMKITFADRSVTEGCCTVRVGSVIIDLGLRWDLSQPVAEVDLIIEYLRGLVYTPEFATFLKAGIVPTV